MNNSKPDWFTLVEHWVNLGGQGYTLPFLVAARARIQGNDKPTLQDCRDLLTELLDKPFGDKVIEITLCADLGSSLIGISRETIPGQEFKSRVTGKPSVFVREDVCRKWGKTFDAITQGMLEEARDAMESRRFSRSHTKTWGPLTNDEISRIDRLLTGS